MNQYVAYGGVGKYIQGADAIDNLAKYALFYCTNSISKKRDILIIIDPFVNNSIGKKVDKMFKKEDLNAYMHTFCGECFDEEIDEICKKAEDIEPVIVIGIGGGKSIDCSKVVANRQKSYMICVPTIAANDAPTSAITVVNKKDATFDYIYQCSKNPDLVLVDTQIIAKAPVRFLIAGMADAIATHFEAISNKKNRGTNFVYLCNDSSYTQSIAGLCISKACYDVITRYAISAKVSAEGGVCSTQLESVIEANILLSGLGFENCGVSAAHAIYIGLSTLKQSHKFYHGEIVAFGVIVLMIIEDYPTKEIDDLLELFLELNLPTTLQDLNLESIGYSKWEEVACVINQDSTGIKVSSPTITNKQIIDSIHLASSYAENFRLKVTK